MGRLAAHKFGGPFSLPQRPNAEQWRIISPGLQEGIGRAGAGRVTHVVDGALSMATHVFFRPDMVVPQFVGEAHQVDVELAPDSGTLLLQVGEPPVQAVHLRPGAYRASVSGSQWATSPGVLRFQLKEDQGRLFLVAGTKTTDLGTFRPGRLELSSQDEWARVTRLSVNDGQGAPLFAADFRQHGLSKSALNGATVLGAVLGVALTFLLVPFSVSASAGCLFGLMPMVGVLALPRDTWLHAVERLYLSKVPPSDLAAWVLFVALLVPIGMATHKFVRSISMGWAAPQRWMRFPMWLGMGAMGLVAGWYLHGGTALGWTVVGAVLLLGGLDAHRNAPPAWWLLDGLAWLFVAFLGADVGALFVLLWRMIVVIGTTHLWLSFAPSVAVRLLLISGMAIPLALETWIRASPLDSAWQTNRLAGERPNEKGWEDPRAGWTGQCGEKDAAKAVNVVVAGGSSVGGAYQFGGEPEAFFTAVAHKTLCAALPADIRLTTHNFGDGDRNTFTISRTINDHLQSADILVLYVGVNDVFTTQNTRTRKEREARADRLFSRFSWLPEWFDESRLAVGLSLWFRAPPALDGAQVADVPLPDAKENHQTIIQAAQENDTQVLLMTEYVRTAERNRLVAYSEMQRAMTDETVRWVDVREAFVNMPDKDALVDSNHLSRQGNNQLGQFLASALTEWVYGSSR